MTIHLVKETVSILQSIQATLEKGLGQANDRLAAIERHHKDFAADLALFVQDPNITALLHPDTVSKLSVRNFERTVPASTRLLATTELMEAILLLLPMRRLLFVQGVSTRFKEVIDHSSAIQRALYFEPEDASSCAKEGKSAQPVPNPLLVGRQYECNKPVVMNKAGGAFALMFLVLGPRESGINIGMIDVEGFQPDTYERAFYTRTGLCFPTGSWRRMFLTQPPTPCEFDVYGAETLGVALGPRRLGEVWQPHCYGSVRSYLSRHSQGETCHEAFPDLA